MIRLTRLNGGPFLLNPDLIEHVETTPDTVINLTTGHQFMVRESAEDVVNRVLEFRRAIAQPAPEGLLGHQAPEEPERRPAG
jgi:flagellar protein FlbD